MSMKHFKVTVSFDISVLSDQELDISEEHLRTFLAHILGDWSDGRYPLSVEMMQLGLGRVMDQAVARAVEEPMRLRHGNRMIAGKVVASYLADKKLAGLSVHGHRAVQLVDVEEVKEPWARTGE